MTAREVLENADGLPTLSGAVAGLARLRNDPDARAKDFERVVTPDPALTTNLLRLANSPLFGARRQIASVKQAITLLGVERVFDVAVSASFSKVLPQKIPGFDILAKNFFRHSFIVGAMAERLSKRKRIFNTDLIFTAGLLHDIGKLAIGSLLYDISSELGKDLKKEEVPFISSEQAIVGTNHAEVGELMADTWDLPELIGVSARWHHHPDDVPDSSSQSLVDLVHIADGLAHMIGFGADVGELKRSLNSRSMARLTVKVADLENVALETTEQVADMDDIFGGHA
jgi:putative nucleotidyltransferase with HDIG domain